MAHGRFAEAEKQLNLARQLDPLALIVDVDLTLLRKYQRDYKGVVTVSESILQRDPNYALGYVMLLVGYRCDHRYDEWRVADAKKPLSDIDRAVVNGQSEDARRVLQKQADEAKAGLRRPFDVFSNMVKAGHGHESLDWMDQSYQHHDYWLLFINVDPEMDPVRNEPRFQALVHKLGIG